MKQAGRLALMALTLAVPLAGRVAADGLVRDGVGPISTGRGGTNIAHSDNGVIILDNPAGMANFNGHGFYELGVDAVVTDLDYSDPDNDVEGKFRPYPSGNLAYIRKSHDGVWAWGVGVFAPAGFGAEYDMQHPVLGPSTYKSIGLLGKVLPGVACRVTDRLSVGASFGLAFSHAELEGPFVLQTGMLAGVPTRLDLQANGLAPAATFGLQYQLTPRTRIGVAYTEESRFHLDGIARTDVFGLAPVPLQSNFDAEVDLVWPRSLGVGVRHDLSCCRRVSADVVWYDWSHAFDQLDITLTNASNPLFTALLGPVIQDSLRKDWEDSISVRLGYEWDSSACSTWRLGYFYHDSPVPNETLNPYLDGVLEHGVSIGYSRIYGHAILNFAYQYSFGSERRIDDSAIVGGDFDNSTFEAQAHWLSFSVLVPF